MHRINFKLHYPQYDISEISDYIVFKNLILDNKDKPIIYRNDEIYINDDCTRLSISYTIYGMDMTVQESIEEAINRIKYYIVLNGLDEYISVKQDYETNIILQFFVNDINELKVDFKLRGII